MFAWTRLDNNALGRITEQEVLTRESLANFDGKDGRRAYVAHAGKIYDVTDSVLWGSGEHQGEHLAGVDLTAAMVSWDLPGRRSSQWGQSAVAEFGC